MMRLLLLLGVLVLSGCASDGDVLEPAELTEYPARAEIKTVWKTNPGGANVNAAEFFVPHLDADAIFTVNRQGEIVRSNKADGEEVWRKSFEVAFLAGLSGTSDTLFATTFEGELLAVKKADGDLRWRREFGVESLAPPATTANGDTLVLQTNDGMLIGLNVSDGAEIWRYTYQKPVLTLHGYATPLIVPGGVLAGLDDGSLVALTISDGRMIWQSQVSRAEGRSEIERMVDVDGKIVIDQQYIYAVNYQGKLVQLEPQQGKTLWSRDMTSTSGVSVDDKWVYVTEPDGYVWALDKRTGSSMWKMEKLEGRRLTRPVPYRDYVLVGDLEGYVHILSKFDGSLVARSRVDNAPIVSDPIVDGDKLYVQSRAGVLRQLQIDSLLGDQP